MVTQERYQRQNPNQEIEQTLLLQPSVESGGRSRNCYVTDVDKNELARQAVELRQTKDLGFDPATIDLTKVDLTDAMSLITLAIELGLNDEVETMLESKTSIAFTLLMNHLTDAINHHLTGFAEKKWDSLVVALQSETEIDTQGLNELKQTVLKGFPSLELNIGCSPLVCDTLDSEHLSIRIYTEMYDEVSFAFNTEDNYPEMQHCIEEICHDSAFTCTEQLQHYGYCHMFEYIDPKYDSDPNDLLEVLKNSDYFIDFDDMDSMDSDDEYREDRYNDALFHIESYIEYLSNEPKRNKNNSALYEWVVNNKSKLKHSNIEYDGMSMFFATTCNYHDILKSQAEEHIMNGMEDFFCMTLETESSINILETLTTNNLILAILSAISLLKL